MGVSMPGSPLGTWLVVLGLALVTPLVADGHATLCSPDVDGGPYRITEGCVDPTYGSPIFTNETDEIFPVHHRRVSGYFNGTKVDFNFYLPPPDLWKGRFFQHVYPLQDSNARSERIAFGVNSGAYTVNVAGAGGYRADAAAAKVSRKFAAEYYNQHSERIYGYIYGGSGGSFVTAGAMESTYDVWDGGILMVQGIPVSNPNNFAARAFSGLVLESKKAEISDTLAPGGSGDPFSILTEMERGVLREVTALGVPLAAWENFDAVGRNGERLLDNMSPLVSAAIRQKDPTFPHDFWNEPGYVGTEDLEIGEIFRNSLVLFNSTVQDVVCGNDSLPVAAILTDVPANISLFGLDFNIYVSDQMVPIAGQLDAETKTISIKPTSNATSLAAIRNGVTIQIDNRLFLSGFALYRHQVPPVEDGFYGYDVLRSDKGEPLYPQRDVLIAPSVARSASGDTSHSGNITAKVMVLQTLLDQEAWPWHADWYMRRVKAALGDRFEDNYRLYYMESGVHYIESPHLDPPDSSRVVPAGGHVEQHLLDLSDWVERGINPPTGTGYTIDELSQIHLAAEAVGRGGIQPIVSLTVGGTNITEAAVGVAVTFQLNVETPPDTGDVVSVEWDFEGTGIFDKANFGAMSPIISVEATHAYEGPGVYFAGVRVSSQRDGNAETPFARVWNLARVRVIVE